MWFMITIKEITKLNELARIKLTEKEKRELKFDMEAILDYFKKLASLDINNKSEFSAEEHDINFNEFREDKEANKEEKFSEILLAQAPEKKKGYIKVKKIL